MVDTNEEDRALFPERAGDRLRAARIKAGLDLTDVASRTRIPLRHLQAIEAGDYSSFPSSTYCIGFVKAYARAVDENENEVAQQLRIELGQEAHGYRTELQDYDDADPARIPSRTLAWTAAAIALILAVGYGIWRTQLLSGPEVAPTAVEAPATLPPAASRPVATAPATGQVVLTAIEPVWVRIYDASDKVLFEKEMAKGESYSVPGDADNPKIRTGRAELIAVTVNGAAVPALGPAEKTVKDVGISAAALAARGQPAASPPPQAGAPAVTSASVPPAVRPVVTARQPADITPKPPVRTTPAATSPAPQVTPSPKAVEPSAPPPGNAAAPPAPQA